MNKKGSHKLVVLGTLFFSISTGNCESLKVVTDTTTRESTSAKPTTLYRRINVNEYFDRRINSPQGVWEWDTLCRLQPKRGNCSKTLTRFYYDIILDKCLKFSYTGCNENKNNFDSVMECETQCKGAVYMQIQLHKYPVYCNLQRDPGNCMAYIPKYFYDVNENTCKSFVFGGCGGNPNRFGSVKTCMKTCGQNNSQL